MSKYLYYYTRLPKAFTFLLLVLITCMLLGDKSYSTDGGVPQGEQDRMIAYCPGDDGASLQTVHNVYFLPDTVSSDNGTGSTNFHGTSLMCSNYRYSRVENIHIWVDSVVRTNGSGNISFNSGDFYPPNIYSFHHAVGPWTNTAFFNSLSEGLNCWNIYYHAEALHDGRYSRSSSPGIDNVCVNYRRTPRYGNIMGRIWNDINGNGVKEGWEPLLQFIIGPNNNPPWPPCGSGYRAEWTFVTVWGPQGFNPENHAPDKCNPEPFYDARLPEACYNVEVRPPPGWYATTGNSPACLYAFGNPSVQHRWFGVRKPDVTVEGRIFKFPSQVGGGGVGGVRVWTCNGHVWTGADGFFRFTRWAETGYCIRPDAGYPAYTIGPYVRPWAEGYGGQSPGCPGFGFSQSSPMVNHGGSIGNRNYCALEYSPQRYECQLAGIYVYNSGCGWRPGWDRGNDWGFDVAFIEDRPASISLSASCTNRTVTISASDPDSRSGDPWVLVDYSIDGANSSVWVNGTHTINMSGYNQYDNHNISATNRGKDPHGNTPGLLPRPTATVRYGNPSSPARACIDRDVTLAPYANVQLNSDEAPTSVTFTSGINANVTQSGGPSTVNGVNFDRRFFIRRPTPLGPVEINLLSPSPSSPDPRVVNVPRSGGYNVTDSGSLAPIPQVGDEVCVRADIRPTGSKIDTQGNFVPAGGNGATANAEACERVVVKPYFRVYNSDVSAGFVQCPGWSNGLSNAAITGYNASPTTPGKGSGTQLAAFAINTINGFTSATGRTAPPVPAKGLTFANNGGTYGTGFGSGFCAVDYFATRPSGLPSPGTSPINLTPLLNGGYEASGDNVLVGGTLASNKRISLYINGNVFITNDVQFATVWSAFSEIPNFTMVVRGNIYISPTVGNLDGFYVAQPRADGSGGQIYTCAVAFGPPSRLLLADDIAGCRSRRLTVNGAFLAKRIRLLRSIGSLKDSCNAEPRNVAASCPTSNMAERFIFSPEMWMSSAIAPNNREQFDAVTTAPPVL